MEAVGLYKHLPIEDPQSPVDLDIQEPKHPTEHDLLHAIRHFGRLLKKSKHKKM
jgi:hypothetical protein